MKKRMRIRRMLLKVDDNNNNNNNIFDIDNIQLVKKCYFHPTANNVRCRCIGCNKYIISDLELGLLYAFDDCAFIVDQFIKNHIKQDHPELLRPPESVPYGENRLNVTFEQGVFNGAPDSSHLEFIESIEWPLPSPDYNKKIIKRKKKKKED